MRKVERYGWSNAVCGNAAPLVAACVPRQVLVMVSCGDLKITPGDRLTWGFQYSSFDGRFIVSSVTFNVNNVAPGNFTTTSTHGTAGLGDMTTAHQERNRFNRTYMPTLIWRHDGPVWKADAAFGFSQQSDFNRDAEQGFFRTGPSWRQMSVGI